MRYLALATDFDDTLAHEGAVLEETYAALAEIKASSRKLIMVTGRELRELLPLLPTPRLFDRIVAENGGILYRPEDGETLQLGTPPARTLVEGLQRSQLPFSEGKIILATREPHHLVVLELIRQLGLESQVIFNKGAVMILPSGINKASGLAAALKELNISRHQVVGVGDAENDHAFLEKCGLAVAVANALPSLKQRVHLVLQAERGQGVAELIHRILAEDIREPADIEPASSVLQNIQ